MTRVVANSQLNMTTFMAHADLAGLFAAADVLIHTSTTFRIKDVEDTQEVLTLTGSFGGYNGGVYPTTGTITGGSYSPGNLTGFASLTFSSASISVEDFTHYVNTNDVAGLFRQLLQGADQVIGSALADVLYGFAGNDLLDGRAGADRLIGGFGNDTYIVDNAADVVTELASQGTDVVRSSVTYALGVNVEVLTLTGTATINGTGNALNNVIIGNSANNLLNGGTGADSMRGGSGNDTYVVDNTRDRAVEGTSAGTDLVRSSVSFGLGANVENLVLTGTSATNGYGNGLNNVVTGNGANNILNAGAGNDSIRGGGGNDSILGAAGSDTLTGGTGADSFIFNAPLGASTNVDRITDFSVAADTMRLDDDIFTAVGAVGTLSTAAFRTGTAARDADDRVIYDSATGRIYYDADGNGAGAQVLFAQVSAGLALTSADFLIVG